MAESFHFPEAELVCKHGCGMNEISREDLDALEELRLNAGDKPIVLSSAYRCPDYNAQVSSTGRDGPHTIGAFDMKASGRRAHELLEAVFTQKFRNLLITAERLLDRDAISGQDRLALAAAVRRARGPAEWSGVGISQRGPHGDRFIHVDRLAASQAKGLRPWAWSY